MTSRARRRKTPSRNRSGEQQGGSNQPSGERVSRRSAVSKGLTVLVTGSSGMLGNHIVEELLTGKLAMAMGVKEVRLFDVKPFVRLGDLSFERTRPNNKNIVLKRITGDITNLADVKSAVQGCNAVIHACSVVDFGNIPKNVIWKVNVDGTKNVSDDLTKPLG